MNIYVLMELLQGESVSAGKTQLNFPSQQDEQKLYGV